MVDQCSRRVLGFEVFAKEPNSAAMEKLFSETLEKTGAKPRYVVSDKGRQFECRGFRGWCERHGIRPRYAAAGSLHATAIIERFHRSLKEEWLRHIQIPLGRDKVRTEIELYLQWFAVHRPHQGIGGKTPGAIYDGKDDKARPAGADCVWDGKQPLELVIEFHERRRQLPIVHLKERAA